jgi:acetyl-CoA synthetase (ADP-forming)
VRLADQIGYPVVMKVISPDVVHKSDVGGVRLDIRDKIELRGAATGIQQRLRSHAPAARFEGFACNR